MLLSARRRRSLSESLRKKDPIVPFTELLASPRCELAANTGLNPYSRAPPKQSPNKEAPCGATSALEASAAKLDCRVEQGSSRQSKETPRSATSASEATAAKLECRVEQGRSRQSKETPRGAGVGLDLEDDPLARCTEKAPSPAPRARSASRSRLSEVLARSRASAGRAASAVRAALPSPRSSLASPRTRPPVSQEAEPSPAAAREPRSARSATGTPRKQQNQTPKPDTRERHSRSENQTPKPEHSRSENSESSKECAYQSNSEHEGLIRQLVDAAYKQSLSDDQVIAVVDLCPEISWLAQCAINAPLPPGWQKEKLVTGDMAYMKTDTGQYSNFLAVLPQFGKLAELVLHTRQTPKMASRAASYLIRTKENAMHDCVLAQEEWDGPYTDKASGAQYYHCKSTGASSWGNPASAATYVAYVAEKLLQSDAFPAESSADTQSLLEVAEEIQTARSQQPRVPQSGRHRSAEGHSARSERRTTRENKPHHASELRSARSERCRAPESEHRKRPSRPVRASSMETSEVGADVTSGAKAVASGQTNDAAVILANAAAALAGAAAALAVSAAGNHQSGTAALADAASALSAASARKPESPIPLASPAAWSPAVVSPATTLKPTFDVPSCAQAVESARQTPSKQPCTSEEPGGPQIFDIFSDDSASDQENCGESTCKDEARPQQKETSEVQADTPPKDGSSSGEDSDATFTPVRENNDRQKQDMDVLSRHHRVLSTPRSGTPRSARKASASPIAERQASASPIVESQPRSDVAPASAPAAPHFPPPTSMRAANSPLCAVPRLELSLAQPKQLPELCTGFSANGSSSKTTSTKAPPPPAPGAFPQSKQSPAPARPSAGSFPSALGGRSMSPLPLTPVHPAGTPAPPAPPTPASDAKARDATTPLSTKAPPPPLSLPRGRPPGAIAQSLAPLFQEVAEKTDDGKARHAPGDIIVDKCVRGTGVLNPMSPNAAKGGC